MSGTAVIDVRIDGLGSGGDGVGRLDDGRVVFVPRAFPGDRVRVELGEVRKRLQYAELLQVVEASAQRVPSACKVSNCGGCPARGFDFRAQGEWKRQRVLDNLQRIAHLNVASVMEPIWQFGDGWRYRHRVRLHAEWRGDRFRIGYFRRRSRRLVPVSSCPVLWHELEQLALNIDHRLGGLPREAALDQVEIAYSRTDGRGAARITTRGPVKIFRAAVDELLASGLSGIEIQGIDGRCRFGNLQLRYDHSRSKEFDLRFEPSSFTQAHPDGNQRLVETVLARLRPSGGTRVLELHAGIGNFSIPLSRSGARVIAVESGSRAAILCRRNARAAGVSVDVREQLDNESLHLLGEVDCVLLDPPRIGAKDVAVAIGAMGPPRVVYVSCDTATLARDAAILVQGGYRIVGAEAFDMFPQTSHVETVFTFERPG